MRNSKNVWLHSERHWWAPEQRSFCGFISGYFEKYFFRKPIKKKKKKYANRMKNSHRRPAAAAAALQNRNRCQGSIIEVIHFKLGWQRGRNWNEELHTMWPDFAGAILSRGSLQQQMFCTHKQKGLELNFLLLSPFFFFFLVGGILQCAESRTSGGADVFNGTHKGRVHLWLQTICFPVMETRRVENNRWVLRNHTLAETRKVLGIFHDLFFLNIKKKK